jgi:hypothetical protein
MKAIASRNESIGKPMKPHDAFLRKENGMSKKISPVQNDVQDRESYACKKLCDYIECLASDGIGISPLLR